MLFAHKIELRPTPEQEQFLLQPVCAHDFQKKRSGWLHPCIGIRLMQNALSKNLDRESNET